jgi:hypothetical protein
MASPFSLPPSDPAAAAAGQIIQSANFLWNLLTQRYVAAYNVLWNNPRATPQQVVAALGTQAVLIFTRSAELAAFLAGAGVTGIPLTVPAGWSYTANPDGSITLTPPAAT